MQQGLSFFWICSNHYIWLEHHILRCPKLSCFARKRSTFHQLKSLTFLKKGGLFKLFFLVIKMSPNSKLKLFENSKNVYKTNYVKNTSFFTFTKKNITTSQQRPNQLASQILSNSHQFENKLLLFCHWFSYYFLDYFIFISYKRY